MKPNAKEAELLERADLLDTILDHVAAGGTVPGLAEVWQVRASVLFAWLRASDERMEQYKEAQAQGGEWMTQRLRELLKELALTDIRELYDEDGNLKRPHEMSPAAARLVAGLDVTTRTDKDGVETESQKVRLTDRLKAIEQAGKMLGLFTEKAELTVRLEDLVAASKK